MCIRAFCGGLQARLWQAKIGLQSFVMRFFQAAHRVAQENSFCFLRSLSRSPRFASMYETSPMEVAYRSVCVHM